MAQTDPQLEEAVQRQVLDVRRAERLHDIDKLARTVGSAAKGEYIPPKARPDTTAGELEALKVLEKGERIVGRIKEGEMVAFREVLRYKTEVFNTLLETNERMLSSKRPLMNAQQGRAFDALETEKEQRVDRLNVDGWLQNKERFDAGEGAKILQQRLPQYKQWLERDAGTGQLNPSNYTAFLGAFADDMQRIGDPRERAIFINSIESASEGPLSPGGLGENLRVLLGVPEDNSDFKSRNPNIADQVPAYNDTLARVYWEALASESEMRGIEATERDEIIRITNEQRKIGGDDPKARTAGDLILSEMSNLNTSIKKDFETMDAVDVVRTEKDVDLPLKDGVPQLPPGMELPEGVTPEQFQAAYGGQATEAQAAGIPGSQTIKEAMRMLEEMQDPEVANLPRYQQLWSALKEDAGIREWLAQNELSGASEEMQRRRLYEYAAENQRAANQGARVHKWQQTMQDPEAGALERGRAAVGLALRGELDSKRLREQGRTSTEEGETGRIRPGALLTQAGRGLAKPITKLMEKRADMKEQKEADLRRAEVDPSDPGSIGRPEDVPEGPVTQEDAEEVVWKRGRRPGIDAYMQHGVKPGIVEDTEDTTIFTMSQTNPDGTIGPKYAVKYNKNTDTYTTLRGVAYKEDEAGNQIPTEEVPKLNLSKEEMDEAKSWGFEGHFSEADPTPEPDEDTPGLELFEDIEDKRRKSKYERGKATERYIPVEEQGLGLGHVRNAYRGPIVGGPPVPGAVPAEPGQELVRPEDAPIAPTLTEEEAAEEAAEPIPGFESNLQEMAEREAILEKIRAQRETDPEKIEETGGCVAGPTGVPGPRPRGSAPSAAVLGGQARVTEPAPRLFDRARRKAIEDELRRK